MNFKHMYDCSSTMQEPLIICSDLFSNQKLLELLESGRRAFRSPDWFVLFDLHICQVVFIPRAQPHALSLFSISNSFWYWFDSFFRWEEGRRRKFDRLFRCFDPLSRHLTEAKRRMGTVSKSVTFLATESVNSAPFKRGETKVQVFGKEKCKIHRHFHVTEVTSLPSLSLSLSLSHLTHLTHNIGSASALPIMRMKTRTSQVNNGAPAYYIMVSKVQWKPFWLVTQPYYHRTTGLGGQMVWTMTCSHRPHWTQAIEKIFMFCFVFARKSFSLILYSFSTLSAHVHVVSSSHM